MTEGDSKQDIPAKTLMAKQKEEKGFKRAVKAKKRQAEGLGVTFDKKKAKVEVLEEFAASKSKKEDAGVNVSDLAQPGHEVDSKRAKAGSKKNKRFAEDDLEDKPLVKKSKKSKKSKKDLECITLIQLEEVEVSLFEKKKESKQSPIAEATTLTQESGEEELTSKKKKKKYKSTPEDEAENNPAIKKKAKKSKSPKGESSISPPSQGSEAISGTVKKSKMTELPQVTKQARIEEKHAKKIAKKQALAVCTAEKQVEKVSKSKQEKESKGNNAEQWNPDALSGDAMRKSKFLRLLGAGKSKDDATMGNGASKKSKEEIDRVQSELERQYETGMKMKHEMGAKRRGLGA